jgi:hypothetical protein
MQIGRQLAGILEGRSHQVILMEDAPDGLLHFPSREAA